MMQYEHRWIGAGMETSVLIDSDRESNKSDDNSDVVKEQGMFVWSPKYEKWHECVVSFSPPCLSITEYEDLKLEVNEKQLMHLTQRWFHGSLTRREARVILQDYCGGNGSFLVRTSESYSGKFAISFVHESRVKHVVIESKRDPVAGVLYNITPNGPFFTSLYDLIEEAQKKPLIQNHTFDIKLGQCPPKPDMTWLHRGVKSLSQAEQILRKEHRDGAFFVYKTQSEYAPYIVAYRSNGSVHHNLIVATQRPSPGYILNNVTSQVLYKIIHYYMENPINGKTVLKYPVGDRDPVCTNCGIAIKDSLGDRTQNELVFVRGALITNIMQKSVEWSVGDHRGDRQKYFKTDNIRLLTKDELAYLTELRLHREIVPSTTPDTTTAISERESSLPHPAQLNLRTDYQVSFNYEESNSSSTILVEPINPVIRTFRNYILSCPCTEDLEGWYQALQQANCLPKALQTQHSSTKHSKKQGCVIS